MGRRQDDSFAGFLDQPGSHLHTGSRTFGEVQDERALERSFRAVGRRLYRELLSLNFGFAAGDFGLQNYSARARARLRTAYFQAFSLGALSVFPFYTLTERDVGVLDVELSNQADHIRRFAETILQDGEVMTRQDRTGLYVLSLRGIFERGRLEAMPRVPIRWELGPSEHCDACRFTSEQGPYQLDTYTGLGLPSMPGTPGNGSVCFGFTRCGCHLVLDSGIPLPNADIKLREVLLEVINGNHSTSPQSGAHKGAG